MEPYIRVATGDHVQLKNERGRDNALAACLNSFAHEFVHYQQWVATREISERGVIRRAQSMWIATPWRRIILDVCNSRPD